MLPSDAGPGLAEPAELTKPSDPGTPPGPDPSATQPRRPPSNYALAGDEVAEAPKDEWNPSAMPRGMSAKPEGSRSRNPDTTYDRKTTHRPGLRAQSFRRFTDGSWEHALNRQLGGLYRWRTTVVTLMGSQR